jgi:hypothetical protein
MLSVPGKVVQKREANVEEYETSGQLGLVGKERPVQQNKIKIRNQRV